MSTADLIARSVEIVLSLTLAVTGVQKVRYFNHFRAVLIDYRPHVDVTALAFAWISIEIGVALLLMGAVVNAAAIAGGAIGLTTGAVLKRLWQRAHHSCGCGLGGGSLSWSLVVRNGALIGLLGAATAARNESLFVFGVVVGVGVAVGAVLMGRKFVVPTFGSLDLQVASD